MSGTRKRLPAANEFSPGVIGGIPGVVDVLRLVAEAKGSRDAAIEAIRDKYFRNTAPSKRGEERARQQRTRAYNTLLGAAQYGLVHLDTCELTQLGLDLLHEESDESRARLLAKHILTELHGLEVLDAVKAMQLRGDKVTKHSLHAELERRGFYLPRATTHHTRLLRWLEAADLIHGQWELNDAALTELTGLSSDAIAEWDGMTPDQRAFLRTLRKLSVVHGTGALPAREVVDAAIAQHGQVFRQPDQLAARVFRPLAASGWITHEVSGKKGRGGKSGEVAATPKLIDAQLDLLPEETGSGIPPDLRPHLRTPLATIRKALGSEDPNKKGQALELLAIRIAIDLGLVPVAMRERSRVTGGAEVDLIAEWSHLQFCRWLLQCKNTPLVNVSAVAKEVGMAALLNAHVVTLVTTGRFSGTVTAYAELLASSTPLQVILIPGDILNEYERGGARVLREHVRSTAARASQLKRGQIVTEGGASS